MATATVLTLREFEELADDGKRHELNQGELVSGTHPKFRHMCVAQNIHDALSPYVREKKIGRVFSEMGYLLSENPPTLRIPDVSYLSQERLGQASSDGYVPGGPELAVEIVSPSDSAEDLQEKVEQYLDSGSQVVWVVPQDTHGQRFPSSRLFRASRRRRFAGRTPTVPRLVRSRDGAILKSCSGPSLQIR